MMEKAELEKNIGNILANFIVSYERSKADMDSLFEKAKSEYILLITKQEIERVEGKRP